MHTLIVGRSKTGKSALGKQIGSHLRIQDKYVLAFNPTGEAGYTVEDEFGCIAADWETSDPDEFAAKVSEAMNAFIKGEGPQPYLIIDEAHEFFTRAGAEYLWIGTRGRHYGSTIIAITQRGAQINPTFRGQCSRIFIFACSSLDAKFLADEMGKEEFRQATNLAPLEYYETDGFRVDKKRI